MGIIVSHPTGNRNVRAIVEGLYSAGNLQQFATTLAVNPTTKWTRFLPTSLKTELLRRSYDIPLSFMYITPWLELARRVLPKIGYKKVIAHEKGWASVDAIYRNLDAAVAKNLSKKATQKPDGVYAYEDGALQTFKVAKAAGITCIYDLPIAYWETLRRLLTEEAERMPQWKKTLGGGIMDSAAKLERKTAELELADIVVGPGNFVLDSIPAWARGKKIIMSPFGTPSTTYLQNAPPVNEKKTTDGPLKVLFAGSMGQRKGLGDLFEAVKMLNTPAVQLVVLGPLQDSLEFYKNQFPDFIHEAVRPHHNVLELMRNCDIFCLPSIVEGRALVIQEAMSQGLPIIITPNTGGADLVKEAETGFLIPIRSPDKIAEKINWFLENRRRVPEMGFTAQQHAATYTWEAYASRIISQLFL